MSRNRGKQQQKVKAQVEKEGAQAKGVTISYGNNKPTSYQVAGQTVGDVRKKFKAALNMKGGEIAKVNGQTTANDYQLRDGDRLEFVKEAGDKGC